MSGTSHDEGVAALVERAIGHLSAYVADHKTDHLRDLAPVVVDLRGAHHLDDGRPDWSGRSPGYRQAMAEVYARASVPPDRLDTVQAALRYHVGNLLRERATDEELAAVGLKTQSPKERLAVQRAALSAQREVAAPRQDAARLAAYAQALVEYVDEDSLHTLAPERVVATRLALEAVQGRSSQLLVRLADAAAGRSPGSGRGRHRGREAGLRSL